MQFYITELNYRKSMNIELYLMMKALVQSSIADQRARLENYQPAGGYSSSSTSDCDF